MHSSFRVYFHFQPREWFIGEEVLPVLRLDVELVDGLVREDVARRLDRRDVGVVVENLLEETQPPFPVKINQQVGTLP